MDYKNKYLNINQNLKLKTIQQTGGYFDGKGYILQSKQLIN